MAAGTAHDQLEWASLLDSVRPSLSTFMRYIWDNSRNCEVWKRFKEALMFVHVDLFPATLNSVHCYGRVSCKSQLFAWMDESSDDPISILPKHGPTPLRKAVPKQRRSNPFYIPTDQNYGSMDEQSSDPLTLPKLDPRVTPKRGVLLQGINPRTPQAGPELKEKRFISIMDADPIEEENGDLTVRPKASTGAEDEGSDDANGPKGAIALDEDAIMQEFWNPATAEEEFDMNDEDGLGSQMIEQDGDYLEEDDDINLLLSEGEFQPHTSDDEITFRMKPDDEQEEIREEIKELLEKIPELGKNYELIDRLGTGRDGLREQLLPLKLMCRYILICFQGNGSQL